MARMTTLTPQQFVAKWRQSALKERSAYQEHFIDLCRLIEHATPAEADPNGEWFAFEYGAAKIGGGQGFADVYKRGYFGWEYKGKHADLDKAYEQLQRYRTALQTPPLLVVCDFETLIIYPQFTDRVNTPTRLTLADLLTARGLDTLRAVFTNPTVFKSEITADKATAEVAEQFSRLAERLRAAQHPPLAAAHFLIRLLFCLFAEDVKLLPEGLFARLIDRTRRQPAVFAAQLRQLFAAMQTGGWFGVEPIKQFNGGLFDSADVLELDEAGLAILAQVVHNDWSAIDVSISGTLFERSLDPAKRSMLGAHYTSTEDIITLLEPVLMAPLRRRWAEVQAQARDLAAQRDAATGRTRQTREAKVQQVLLAFMRELAQVRVLDPACGSGNFLTVALRLLLDLWQEVATLYAELTHQTISPLADIAPSPEQLHGLEKNEYAYELAQANIWIAYLQWLKNNGFGDRAEPILSGSQLIEHRDAIMNPDGTEPAWPPCDVLVGNPPFLGSKNMRGELGDEYVEALWKLYAGRVSSGADLVVFWFEKARAMLETGKVKRVGLLATKVIRQQNSRWILERIKQTGDIFMAWSDRPWILDGASVRIAMIGFDNGSEKFKTLDGQAVEDINADLSSARNIASAQPLQENFNLSFMGTIKVGPFDLTAQQAEKMLAAPPNPNGRLNSDVVRPLINGEDVTGRPRGMWIIDFGSDISEGEAAKYEMPFEYVKTHVKPVRAENNRESYQKYWWIHGESRPAMRKALQGLQRYIVTVLVAKHRLFVWVPAIVSPSARVIVIARDDDYFFGALQSHIHEVWSLRMGGRHGIGNDPTYNNSVCFETFPFPWPPGQEPSKTSEVSIDGEASADGRSDRLAGKASQPIKTSEVWLERAREAAIAAAAKELNDLRDNWLNPYKDQPAALDVAAKKRTLTNLYNENPTWLQLAHRKLDDAVLDAYGWPPDLSDDDLLARLLALNLARAGLPPGVQREVVGQLS